MYDLDEHYMRWLYGLICPLTYKKPSHTYWILARRLYTIEFVWLVENDSNRISDGLELRKEFLSDCNFSEDESIKHWAQLGCSMLEMLIALARRFAFILDAEPIDCFWTLIYNTGLRNCSDSDFEFDDDAANEIDEIISRVIFRQYSWDGRGGLFPLKEPLEDQRKVEVWYQMNAFILEYVRENP